MVRSQKRYRGVRQRQWGSWVSEIRLPSLREKIWLGTFKTEEDSARAYDEAARLMFGSRAGTNFPFNPNAPQTALLSAALTANLHRFYITKQKSGLREPQINPPTPISISGNCVPELPGKGEATCDVGPSLMSCIPIWSNQQGPATESSPKGPTQQILTCSAQPVNTNDLVEFVATIVGRIPPLPPLP